MSFFAELKRRNVFRVAIAYALIAWLIMQVGDTMAPALKLGDWVNSVLAFFLILGFPLALFFAWIFEMTPEGIKLEKNVDRSRSITSKTGGRVDRLITGVLVLAVAYFAVDKFVLTPDAGTEVATAAGESRTEEPAISDQSIAVLPFADLSPEGEQEYFSNGIAEEILNVLVRVEDLSVASRTSSFGFKGQEALAIPYSVLGYAAQESRDLEKALELYDTAIRSDPQNATSWLWRGILYNEIGYFDKAVADIEQCLQIDPLYTNCMRHRARTALFTGDDDLAMELSERAMLLGFGMEGIVLPAYAACGNDEFVLAVLSDYFSDRDMRPLIDYAYRGIVDPNFDFAAERDEIRTVYRATTGKELDWGPDSFLDPMWLGAFELATANHWNQNWWHPYPREFLDSPHRKRLIVEAGLPGYWREHGFPAHCRPLGDDDCGCDKPRRTSDKADRIRAGAPT